MAYNPNRETANDFLSHPSYRISPCRTPTHDFGPNFQEKKPFILIQFFIYLCLETKPIIIFQGIILHADIILAF